MKVIGLCGGSGSGKGSVCRAFSRYDIPSIDADAVYHYLTSSPGACLDELKAEFGQSVVKNGALDRSVLRELVFSGEDAPVKQARLNSITHKSVLDEIRKLISTYRNDGRKGVLVDAPMLFESGFDKECQYTIAVTADQNVRIARIMLRDSITFDQAYRRISLQKSDSWLIENTDFHICNNSTLDDLADRVAQIYDQIFC